MSEMVKTTTPMIDPFGRSITYLRVSVTDRCDLRCVYCMAEDMTFLPEEGLCSRSRSSTGSAPAPSSARGATQAPHYRRRATLVRRDVILWLIQRVGARIWRRWPAVSSRVTTNGSQLERHAAGLYAAAGERVNVSLDTLDPYNVHPRSPVGASSSRPCVASFAATAPVSTVKINTVALAEM